MTDLEITRLCAEAMGYVDKSVGESIGGIMVCGERFHFIWNPLEDDAQAMALVKKFNLLINWNTKTECWVMPMMAEGSMFDSADHANLNRAICECVAKMTKEKAS